MFKKRTHFTHVDNRTYNVGRDRHTAVENENKLGAAVI